jgi:hypothetical protein
MRPLNAHVRSQRVRFQSLGRANKLLHATRETRAREQ